ncbi:MAG: hypothetical protein EXX96DRAFT_569750 [Benjaminiella poitrasii]|nr:MAG: hypothetical protein EXX96DRAFT_569750 [Benjaminiella poitrasii]
MSSHVHMAYFNSTIALANPLVHSHTTTNQQSFALSFISSKDLPGTNEAIPAELIIGWTPVQDRVDPKTFIENHKFVNFLTSVLRENIHKIDDSNLKALADWQKEGWLHINDERNPPAWGRISFPEDIIGSVELSAGKIKEGTYQAMPAHRIVSNKGLFQLSEPLMNYIVHAAKQKVQQ